GNGTRPSSNSRRSFIDRTTVLDQIEKLLSVNPTIVSRSRVKRLRDPAPTQFRLRVYEFRGFHEYKGTPSPDSLVAASATSGRSFSPQATMGAYRSEADRRLHDAPDS